MTINYTCKTMSLVLLCMIAIYLLSAQPAKLSTINSKAIVTYVVDTTIKITKTEITELEKKKLIGRVNSASRRYIHGVVFLLLGLLVQNAVTKKGAKGMKAIAISLAICVAYAATDEIHQLFVPGRSFQVSDLIMDAAGSTIGIAAVWFLYNKVRIKPKS